MIVSPSMVPWLIPPPAASCGLLLPGHGTHWLRALRFVSSPRVPVVVRDLRGQALTVDIRGELQAWYFHQPWRIVEALCAGTELLAIPDAGLLVSEEQGGPMFSCSPAPLGPCELQEAPHE